MSEAALKERYDRQIRVWGAEAQSRIQNSRVLVLGLQGLNVEATKNLVLAGMSVTVQDDTTVALEDLSFNFFLSSEDVGRPTAEAAMPRIHQLNTFTTVSVEMRALKNLDAAFFAPFTVVLMSAKNSTQAEALRVNELCRQEGGEGGNKKKVFFLSDVFGHESFFISDFGQGFQFQPDKKEKKEPVAAAAAPAAAGGGGSVDDDIVLLAAPAAPESLAGEGGVNILTIDFPPLSRVLGKPWAELPSRHFPLSKTFVKARLLALYRDEHAGAIPTPQSRDAFRSWAERIAKQNAIELATTLSDADIEELCRTAGCTPIVTCSTLGSFLAQETIKGVSLSGHPAFNVWVFSCHDYQVRAFPVA